ncbi:MAG TPA: GldG family protein, partial [Candidatus Nitrosotenuis sp.]|nr:GldG family protein [Candidatus Nitrosotenuis sp.]
MAPKTKFAINTFAAALLGILLYLFVLFIAQANSYKFDLTQNKRHSLAQQSIDAVKALRTPVKVLVFIKATDEGQRRRTEELLGNYQRYNKANFLYDIVDIDKEPRKAREYEIRIPGQGVVEQGKRRERVQNLEEQDITRAILKLTRSADLKVYVLTGHGEPSLTDQQDRGLSQLQSALTGEGYTVAELNLASSPKIPEDAALLIQIGPRKGMLAMEEGIIKAYLEKGGRLLCMLEYDSPDSYGRFLSAYGFALPDEVILDPQSQLVGAEPIFASGLVYSSDHAITREFKLNTLFPLARPVQVEKAMVPSGATVRTFVSTGPEAVVVAPSSM